MEIVDRRHQGQGLGSRLLAEALRRAVAASDAVAARLVVVDAIDDDAAAFYRNRGFVDVEENPRRLFRKIADVRRSLEPRSRDAGGRHVRVRIRAAIAVNGLGGTPPGNFAFSPPDSATASHRCEYVDLRPIALLAMSGTGQPCFKDRIE
jgi:hypothetical protein